MLLLLDLDGVLITTPPWKTDLLHADGYSDFNPVCVQQLNTLLAATSSEIWLSSSRRKAKTLEEFNLIFKNRGIQQTIVDFLPVYPFNYSRKKEIEAFLAFQQPDKYLILDDDKSLNGLAPVHKNRLVLTNSLQGFSKKKLAEAIEKLTK
jgi:hypothetical protein